MSTQNWDNEAAGLYPNMIDTYGVIIDTHLYDHVLPYIVRIVTSDGTTVATYGCTSLEDLHAAIGAELKKAIEGEE